MKGENDRPFQNGVSVLPTLARCAFSPLAGQQLRQQVSSFLWDTWPWGRGVVFLGIGSRRPVFHLTGRRFDNNKPLIKALLLALWFTQELICLLMLFSFRVRLAFSSGVVCSCYLIRLCKGLKILQEYQTTPTYLCRHWCNYLFFRYFNIWKLIKLSLKGMCDILTKDSTASLGEPGWLGRTSLRVRLRAAAGRHHSLFRAGAVSVLSLCGSPHRFSGAIRHQRETTRGNTESAKKFI